MAKPNREALEVRARGEAERAAFARCAREGAAFITYRAATVERGEDGAPVLDEEARTVAVAFSSEHPVERYWGVEILDHAEGACDLSRLADRTAPVLVNHRTDDLVGVIESAEIGDDRRGRAVLRFGRSARAEEIWQDVRDGIRSQVSVGYYVLRAVLEETGDDGDVYRVVSWRPVEISFAAIAADPTVGVGRSADLERVGDERELDVVRGDDAPEAEGGLEVRGVETMTATATAAAATLSETELARLRDEARQREDTRAAEIMAAATRWNCREEGLTAIAKGTSAAEFRGWVLENKVPQGQALATPPAAIGLGGRDLKGFSLRRLIVALANRDWSGAELEREASLEVGKRIGREARGAFIPFEVLAAPMDREMLSGVAGNLIQRAAVAKGGSGGNLIATELDGASFIDLLRARMVVRMAGARILPGLVGDVAIPRQTGAASAAWVAEGSGSGDTPQTYDQVTLAPKTVRARSDMTRKMLLQSSPAIEGLTRDDLAKVLGLAIDFAALAGPSGGDSPVGIQNVVGVGSVSFGPTVGGAPTWPLMVQMETEVAVDNADVGALAYISNPKMRGKLKTTEKATNTGLFIWDAGSPEAPVNGYPFYVSTQVPGTLAEGGSGNVLSACYFGNWSDLLIGEWGTLDVKAEDVTLADSGGVAVRAFADVDVKPRHPESFSVATDVVTT
ncbi:MAG: phage major capsid protein [Proteobacteria bacterium]|nr:MAG: phage major capsid protein [Pseudomonadota bacterium]